MLLPSLLLISMMAGSSVSLSLMVSGYNRNLTKLQLTPTFEVAAEFYYHVDLNMSWLQIEPTVCMSCNEVYAIHEVGEYEGVRGGAMSRWGWEKGHLVRQEWVGTGVGPAHLLVDTDTNMAYSANYADGSWTAVRIEKEAGGTENRGFNRTVYQEKFGKGCRNSTAHPHETVSLGEHVWVVDLGCDAIHHYKLDRETRVLNRMADIMVGEGRGPRHMTLLPERGLAMVVCELENYIMLFKVDIKTGSLTKIKELNVVSVNKTAAAEILLHPNREWVYVSSRGQGLVAVFSLSPDSEELTKVQEFNIQGTWPRSMALSPTGDVLAVADQFSDSLQLLAVNPKDGSLSAKGHGVIKTPHQPSFVTFLRE